MPFVYNPNHLSALDGYHLTMFVVVTMKWADKKAVLGAVKLPYFCGEEWCTSWLNEGESGTGRKENSA